MKRKGKTKKVKIVLSEGEKYFCHWDVDMNRDLLSQGCRRVSESPDIRLPR